MTTPGSLGSISGNINVNTGSALASMVALRRKSAATVGTLNSVGRAAIVAGGAMAGIGGAVAYGLFRAAKVTAEFEFKMSYLKATLVATDSEMVRLRESALKFGQTSGYGPKEVADAFVELGKAGVSAEQIIGGVGRAVVTLGQSADIGLSKAASIIVSTQATFGLLASEAQRTADIIQGAANASLIDVQDFGVTMKYVGNVASATGIGLEDLSTGIALVGNQGIRGSTAGTSLRRMLLQLTPRTLKARTAMQDLGIVTNDGTNAFYDMEGRAKSLRDIFQILQDKTKGLTDAQRKDELATIFGDRAIATVLAVTKAGAAGWDEFNKQINESTAAEIAAQRFDNLEGSLRKFKGSLESMQIALGTGTQGPLRELVDNATALVNAFTNADPAMQDNIVRTALLVSGFLILVGTLSIVIGSVMRVVAVIKTMRGAFALLTRTMGLTTAAAAAMQAVMGAFVFAAIASVVANLWGMAAGAVEAQKKVAELTALLDRSDPEAFAKARADLAAYVQAERDAIFEGGALKEVMNLLTGATSKHRSAAEQAGKALRDMDDDLYRSGQAFDQLAAASGISEKALRDAAKAGKIDMSQGIEASGEALLRYYDTTVRGKISSEQLASAVEMLGDEATGAAGEAENLNEALNKLAEININAEEAAINFQEAINDAAESSKKAGKVYNKEGELRDKANEKHLAARSGLLNIASAGLAVYEALQEQGAEEKTLQTTMGETRAAFIKAAEKMGMGTAAANAYADEIGLIPPAKETKFSTPGLAPAKEAVLDYKGIIESIPDTHDILFNALVGKDNVSPMLQGDGTKLLTGPLERLGDTLSGKKKPTKTPPLKKLPVASTTKKTPAAASDPTKALGGGASTRNRLLSGAAATLPGGLRAATLPGAAGSGAGSVVIDQSKHTTVNAPVHTTERVDGNLFGSSVAFRIRSAS